MTTKAMAVCVAIILATVAMGADVAPKTAPKIAATKVAARRTWPGSRLRGSACSSTGARILSAALRPLAAVCRRSEAGGL